MDERFGEVPPETPEDQVFPPVTEEHHGEEDIPPASEERKAEARARLRTRFPEMTDKDFDDVSSQTTQTGKFEIFIQKLMEKYKWRRGVCQQQLGQGFDDIRDC
jgi:hypothetical protein